MRFTGWFLEGVSLDASKKVMDELLEYRTLWPTGYAINAAEQNFRA